MKIVVLLGNQNDARGTLSPVAIGRAETAVHFLQQHDGWIVLPTGAFGAHFNTTDIPHGQYLTNYLQAEGIPAERILPHTNSSTTLEDAICAQKVAEDSGASKLLVITSEFHMQRVQYIFGRVFATSAVNIDYLSAPNQVDDNTLQKLRQHEVRSLQRLQNNWDVLFAQAAT